MIDDDPRLRTDLAFIRTALACFGFGLVLFQLGEDRAAWARPAGALSIALAILFSYRGRRGFWVS